MLRYKENVAHHEDSEILEKVLELLWDLQPLKYLKLSKV